MVLIMIKIIFDELGYNLEPSELSAAFALVQLSKLKENIKKERNFNYSNFLKNMKIFLYFQILLEM